MVNEQLNTLILAYCPITTRYQYLKHIELRQGWGHT